MAFPCLSFCALFLYFGLTCCSARDTITFDKPINSSEGPLVSAGEKFALGFFTPMPNNGTSHGKRYLGIWYHDGLAEPRTVVWVANRDDPLSNSTTWLFGIGDDGNLMLKSDTTTSNRPKKLTNLTGISSPSTRTLKLLDSGNLVLSEAGVDNVSSTMVVWESFLFPTDTFLPGMKMSNNLVLTSWRSQLDPAPGAFVFQQDGERQDQYIITNNELPYWKSGLSEKSLINDEIPPLLSLMLLNTRKSKNGKDCLIVNSTDSKNCNDTLIQSDNYNNTRLVMGLDGKLRFFTRDDPPWSLKWSEPRDRCGKYDACGKFGSCNDDNKVPCKCLPGFSPQSPDNWKNGNFFEGCVRQSSVCDKKKLGNGFLKLRVMKVQKPIFEFGVNNGSECRDKCLGTCKCQAYSYDEGATYLRGRASNCSCRIWIDDLNIIQESSRDGGLDIYLPMNLSEIGSRACGTCGSEIIPYPLSTGSTCGDPMYNGFSCSDTGQISFNASGQTYLVSRIDQEKQRFSIQVEKCRSGDPMEKLLHLPRSSPFVLNSKCQATKDNFDDKWFYEVEFGWNSPLEPTCSSSRDCKDWPNSSCNGAADGKKRCTCSSPFKWDPTKAGCTLASTLNQRSGPSDEKKPLYLILLAVTTTMLFILCAAFAWNVHKRRRRMLNARGNMELSLYNSERRVMDFINSDNFKEDDKKDIDVPYFNLETILIATDNFAEANKLGQGGFGPVYKGKLPRGQEIAIKRLSRGSGQGLEEFKNEVILIAKLQHRNLVRLVGYCVKGYEKMLIYEYMPNKSLDSFLFDRTRGVLLDWEKRIDIIFGIARGLLYLHQDSRLRIIHRDLKTSNILLDDEMKPKISDFGLARIFGGKQIEASTERVVGTYGYMSPEYALDGFFSIKSDVFSFGVVLLETISGKRNTGFYQAEQPLSLLGYAWRLWKDGRSLDLAEQSLRQSCNENEYVRCVNVGLLCVQEDPSERPTMSNVLFMLGSETPSLPIPKQPAYVARRSLSGSASSSSQPQYGSELSTTTLEDSQ